jgi:hypothetical protein
VGWRSRPSGRQRSCRGHHFRGDLDQLLLQLVHDQYLIRSGVANDSRDCRRAHRKRSARQPRPFNRALPFLDSSLACPALLVKAENSIGRARAIGCDEADARINYLASGRSEPAWKGRRMSPSSNRSLHPPIVTREVSSRRQTKIPVRRQILAQVIAVAFT